MDGNLNLQSAVTNYQNGRLLVEPLREDIGRRGRRDRGSMGVVVRRRVGVHNFELAFPGASTLTPLIKTLAIQCPVLPRLLQEWASTPFLIQSPLFPRIHPLVALVSLC